MTTVTPVNLLQLDEYRAPRENLFPSRASLEWFVRQHRAELGQAGALSAPNGKLMVFPDRFDAVVLEIGARRIATRTYNKSKRD